MSHAGGLDGVHHHDNARVRDRDSARDARRMKPECARDRVNDRDHVCS